MENKPKFSDYLLSLAKENNSGSYLEYGQGRDLFAPIVSAFFRDVYAVTPAIDHFNAWRQLDGIIALKGDMFRIPPDQYSCVLIHQQTESHHYMQILMHLGKFNLHEENVMVLFDGTKHEGPLNWFLKEFDLLEKVVDVPGDRGAAYLMTKKEREYLKDLLEKRAI